MTPLATLARLVGLAILGTLVATSTAVIGAESKPHLLALDDARGCAFGPQGEVLGATAGGLVIAGRQAPPRVLTALDGLGETEVARVHVEGGVVHAEGRTTQTDVALDTGRVLRVTPIPALPFAAPEPTSSRRLPSGAELRTAVEQQGNRCWATSAGLYVGAVNAEPARLMQPSLPTGDIAALAAGADRLFVGTFDRGLFVADREGRVTPLANAAVHAHVNALAWDERRDVLWIGTARGLTRCSMAGAPHCQRVGGTGAIHTVVALNDGQAVAGGDAGLTFLDAYGRIQYSLSHKQGAPFTAVWALAASSETLFVGTTRGLFFGPWEAFRGKADDGHPDLIRRAAAITGELTEDWITALAVDADQLVVGLYHSGVVSFSVSRSTLRRVWSDTGLGYVNPAGIVPLGAGRLAIATMDGLRVGKPGDFERVLTLSRDVTGIATLGGRHYVATRRGVQSWSGED